MKYLLSLNKYIFRYKATLFLGILFIILSNVFRILQPQAIRNALDIIIDEINKPNATLDSNMLGNTLMKFGLLILSYAIMMGIFMYFMRQTIIVMSRKVEYDLRKDIFNHYLTLDQNFYKANKTGDLMSRITEDVNKVRVYLGPVILYGINLVALFVVVIITMLKVNFWFSIYTLAPLPILSLIIYYVSNKINKSSERIQQQLAKLTHLSQEAFSGIRVLKSADANENFSIAFNTNAEQQKKLALKLSQIDALFFPSMFFMIGLSTLITLYIGGLHVFKGQVTAGNIAEFVIYTNMLTWPVSAIGWCASMIQQAEASQKRIDEFLKIQPTFTSGETIIDTSKVEIEFENVSYKYPNNENFALQNINVKISKNEKIGIVGTTGSGKTTFIELLIRSFDPTNGQIKINGINIKEYQHKSLREFFSLSPQDVFLFSDTIEENLLISNPNSSEEMLIKASKKAQLHEEIIKIPEKYQAIIGERGISLSGGQKQRLSLARSFLKTSPVLLLDDSLSALDSITEENIMTGLRNDLSQTLVLITHRIEQTKNLDKIFVFHNSKIEAVGTFQELLDSNLYFQKLYQKNNS
ncbi:MAG: ABC transporter ATP-binding protein [Saprospiraceae bacterium]|nr:ABC transporter ATP-binding protein [Saprospiraceae bacterium]